MKTLFIFLGFLLLPTAIIAQPDEAYIQNLTGNIDSEWIQSIGDSIEMQQFVWTNKTAPGFEKTSALVRKQAELSQTWTFFKRDTLGNTIRVSNINLPHNYEDDRDYKSGWYFTKYALQKEEDKQYLLLLDRVRTFSVIFVNATRCRHHFGDVTPFETDITNALQDGVNVIALFVHDQSATVDGNKVYNQIGHTRLPSVYNKYGTKDFPGGLREIPIFEIRERANVKDVFIKTSTQKKELEIECEFSAYSDLLHNPSLTIEVLKWPSGEKVDLIIPTIELPKSSPGIKVLKVQWENPELWSPDHPNLYVLRTTLQNGDQKDVLETRFGFREFWIEGKSFMLNGNPIRLRGESYYHVIKNDRDFHREVFNMHKKLFGSNACRLHAFMPPGEVVEAADEAGILLDDQSAIWSENASYYKNGGEWFLKNTEIEFEEWVRRDRNSPSVVIWDTENEMLRVSYDHLPWVEKLSTFIKKLDNTRPINNSGQGWFSPEQDMVLLHMQEHYTKIVSDWNERGTQPLINGEFWVGGRAEQRLPNSPELPSTYQRYVEEAKIYEDQMLEMRYHNVSGIMPFRISRLAFPDSRDEASFKFTAPDKLEVARRSSEVIEKIRHGLQPVTTFFWPRQNYVPTGKVFKKELVVCNDSEKAGVFHVQWNWDNQPSKSTELDIKPANQKRITIETEYPLGATQLIATVCLGNRIMSSDTIDVTPIEIPKATTKKTLQVYKDQKLAGFLKSEGFEAISTDQVPRANESTIWIIPESSNNRALNSIKKEILTYLNNGGNILCLKQDQAPTWFPVKLHFWSANQTSPHTYEMMGWKGLNKHLFFSTEAPIYAKSHPVFKGINSKTLHVWDKFDGRVSDDVFTRPSNVNFYAQGNWIPLAGGTRREHSSLTEIIYGKGSLLSCQLHVIRNFENAQAKSLFVNMINYLSERNSEPLKGRIAIAGNIDQKDFVKLTGVSLGSLQDARPQNKDLLIAFKGADISKTKNWAKDGGSVIILSPEVAEEFENVQIRHSQDHYYYATQVADHPLLSGITSSNFLDVGNPIVVGCFNKLPANAQVLLQGFKGEKEKYRANLTDLWSVEDSGPVLFSMPFGKGEMLISTLEIGMHASPSARELLCLLLTNAGIKIPYNQEREEEIAIKKTVPLNIDGKLDDWLEDMEDRLVTTFIHAQPVYLTSESRVLGPPEFDLNLSAINYFMWNQNALHIAGVVFGEEKTFESGVHLGSQKEYRQDIFLNEDVISVSFDGNEISALVNGRQEKRIALKSGQIDSRDMTDATLLQFSYILKSGKITTLESLIGECYELSIPWNLLQSKPSNKRWKSVVSVESKGSKLQVPLSATLDSKEEWLNMTIQEIAK